MSSEDYVLNLLLIALVIRQVWGKRLTLFGLLWPVGLVGVAAVKYLHTVPSEGNDLVLVLACGVIGGLLGCLCGLATHIERLSDDGLLAKATGVAALLWTLGVGARLAFAIYATNGGAPTIARFSAEHHITGGAAWTAGLIAMSLAEVLGRTVLLAVRSRGEPHSSPPAPVAP